MAKKKRPDPIDWYSIEASADSSEASVHIYGPIVSTQWDEDEVTAKGFIDAIKGIEAETLNVHINSVGGAVFAGVAIANAIKSFPGETVAKIDGLAASISTVIASAADRVEMAADALYMIHQPHMLAMGDAKALRKQADTLDKVAGVMTSVYEEKSNLPRAEIVAAMDAETWYTADEAHAAGFVDNIYGASQIAACALPDGVFSNAPAALTGNGPLSETATEESPMPEAKSKAQPKAADNVQAIDVDAIAAQARADALTSETARREGISAVFEQFPDQAEMKAECLNDMQMSVEATTAKLLASLGSKAQASGHDISEVSSHRENFLAGLTDGMLIRAGVKKDDGEHNPFRTFGMQDSCRAVLEHNGIATASLPTEQIIKMALTHSSGDFPIAFQNIMHKTLLGAFAVAPDTWSQFCSVGDVSDFRTHNRYRAGSFADLQGLNENGEIRNVTTGDAEKETISASENGVIFNLSYAMIVNDDMGYFLNVSRNLGRAAKRSVENDVYALLAANPTMGDGTALYHADHGNLAGSGTAISVASIGAAQAAMLAQMDPDSNEYLDISPSILLVPVSLLNHARQVLESETDWASNGNSKKINPVRNIVTPVASPRLSGTAWHLFTDPSTVPTLEVAFLNGQREPQVAMEDSFTSRGVAYRVVYDYGVAAVESRATYKNGGA